MTTLSVGNFVSFQKDSVALDGTQLGVYKTTSYFFQNFFISQSMSYDGNEYMFVPFGFSGVTINRTADGTDASLVFPIS